MSEKQETTIQAIPKDYCIMKLKVVDREITEIGIVKVRNNIATTVYTTEITPTIESLDTIITRILEIIGTDTIFYINKEIEIELLKQKCESMQLSITNELINSQKVLHDIEISRKGFVCNYLELKVKI